MHPMETQGDNLSPKEKSFIHSLKKLKENTNSSSFPH